MPIKPRSTKRSPRSSGDFESRAKPRFGNFKPARGRDRDRDRDDRRRDNNGSEDDGPAPSPVTPIPTPPAKKEFVVEAFDKLWTELFLTQTHLDSALSKQHKSVKSILAQITPIVLMKPVSIAQALGVGVMKGEPWKLKNPDLAHWRPSVMMAERLYSLMTGKFVQPKSMEQDFPPVMTESWRTEYGEAVMRELIESLSQEAPLSLRAARSIDPAQLVQELKKEAKLSVKIEPSGIAPSGVRLGGYAQILNTSIYEKGRFEIQDEGSQLMSLFALWPDEIGKLLKPRPGRVENMKFKIPANVPAWTVVDACAGAGGKSLAIADALKGKGRVYSYDTSKGKLEALRRRATRAGVNNIQTVVLKEGEEKATIAKFKQRANVVLVDAPCSGWGVLRRNPDIKWRQTPDVLERMPVIQKRLLSLYASLAQAGGRLVYGVCTFRKAETIDIVADFLENHPEFEKGPGGFLGPSPCDGFFMQSFTKKG